VRETDDDKLIEAILASGVKIPPIPAALLEVLDLERDDNAGAREYAQAIGRDPAMAGAVFRVVGSPVMGLRAKVETLDKAVSVLGLRTTLAVVRSEGLRGALHDPALATVMNTLWQRMNTVADWVLVTLRALRLRAIPEDMAYQCAIFHDCGVAVLCRRDARYAAAFADPARWPDLHALDAEFRTSHAVVGQMVARNWQLPKDVADTIRQHHERQPETLPESLRALIVLVQFACHLLAAKTGADDSEWDSVWKSHAQALFRACGRDVQELEEELLNSAP
jgi:HD-like signal output (HDOD) protein